MKTAILVLCCATCFGAEYTVQPPDSQEVHDFGSQSWAIVNSSGTTVWFCADEIVCNDWAEALNEAHDRSNDGTEQ